MSAAPEIALEAMTELKLDSRIGQLRAAPVRLGEDRAILAAHCADFDVDPYVEMFFFPTDTLKLTLFTPEGEVLWRKDLGPGVVPGVWFCPVLPFDLDGDGADEIWFVNNLNTQHPLGPSGYRLERLDARTGATTGQWPWRDTRGQDMSHSFRNFITGGHAGGEPVLVSAQGTYGDMFLTGWRPDMTPRWEVVVKSSDPGARGSHMCAISDMDGDGVQEVLWGERCIELAEGRELFCADRDTWRGHSDVATPVLDRATGRWFFYTCRESDGDVAPRVALYDSEGRRLWGHVDRGHVDMGWVARLGDAGELVATAIRIGAKTCGPDGRFHQDMDEFAFDLLSGDPLELPFSTYRTIPVDVNGDGLHELVRGRASGDGEVLDRTGRVIANLGGAVGMLSKFLDLPGEQLLSYHEDGTVRIWADGNAEDGPVALERSAHPLYAANQRLTATGYNLNALGGI